MKPDHEHRLHSLEQKINLIEQRLGLDDESILNHSIGDRIMEAIQAFAGRVKASFQQIGASIDGVQADVTELKRIITELQNSPGTISAEDQASLDEAEALAGGLVTRLADLDAATAPAVVPTPTP